MTKSQLARKISEMFSKEYRIAGHVVKLAPNDEDVIDLTGKVKVLVDGSPKSEVFMSRLLFGSTNVEETLREAVNFV